MNHDLDIIAKSPIHLAAGEKINMQKQGDWIVADQSLNPNQEGVYEVEVKSFTVRYGDCFYFDGMIGMMPFRMRIKGRLISYTPKKRNYEKC